MSTATERSEASFHTLPEVAEILKVSRATVQNLIASGDLQAVRIGPRVVRVTAESLNAALRPYTANGGDAA